MAAAVKAARFPAAAAVGVAIPAKPIRAATTVVVDAAILPRPIRAATTVAVDAAIPRRPIRTAAIPAGTEVITEGTEEATPPAASTPDEVITTADASMLVRTSALGSAFHSATATTRMEAAVTMTPGVIGIRLRAIPTPTTTVTTDRAPGTAPKVLVQA